MTQDEILNLARQAEGQVTMWVNHSTTQKTTTFTFESPIDYYVSGEYPEKYHIKFLEAFAKLVAAKEREACAGVCDELVNEENSEDYRNAANWCLVRIRARGQT